VEEINVRVTIPLFSSYESPRAINGSSSESFAQTWNGNYCSGIFTPRLEFPPSFPPAYHVRPPGPSLVFRSEPLSRPRRNRQLCLSPCLTSLATPWHLGTGTPEALPSTKRGCFSRLIKPTASHASQKYNRHPCKLRFLLQLGIKAEENVEEISRGERYVARFQLLEIGLQLVEMRMRDGRRRIISMWVLSNSFHAEWLFALDVIVVSATFTRQIMSVAGFLLSDAFVKAITKQRVRASEILSLLYQYVPWINCLTSHLHRASVLYAKCTHSFSYTQNL